ncbi:MAG: hypothetical protein ACLQGP_06850 [Isosphaeraceae bacterium]
MSRPDSISRGVADAWDTYLNEHNVSVPQLIEGAIVKAVTKWLEAREDEIIEARAQACRGPQSLAGRDTSRPVAPTPGPGAVPPVRACYRCRSAILAARDTAVVTTLNGDATMPARVRLCPECRTSLAAWLRSGPVQSALRQEPEPTCLQADVIPVRLSDAFLRAPAAAPGWRPADYA